MIIRVDECFDYECEAWDDLTVVIFQIYFGVPRCTVKIFVCCDVQCEGEIYVNTIETRTISCSQIDC